MAQQVREGVIEAVGASIANKATLGGALTGVLGWLAQVNWIGLSGVLIALAGLALNHYFQVRREKREYEFQIRRDRREEAESAARIEALRERCGLVERQP